jgi:N-acetylmuramoyl-L-alanine amidase
MSAARIAAATASLCLMAAVAVAADGGGGSAEPAGAFRSLRPAIRSHPIPYGAERKSDMAAYAKRHYGMHTYRLREPHVIVEHIAVAGNARTVWNTFAPNQPDPELHELPGVCAHFVVSARGRIQQLVPLKLMCRHTVGLNYTAIGIEHVGFSDGDLLGNRRQLRASLRLTRWLRCSRGIRVRDVIGHNESLSSPYHRERVRRLRDQTHGDMTRSSMRKYRRKLRARPCPAAPAGARAAGGPVGRVASRVVGQSVQGRPIRAFRIGDRSSPRKVLVVGSMHGNEPAGLDVVRALRRSDVRGVDVWVVPTINPDGLRAGTRHNARGVDLNRNFPYRWRHAGYPWSQYYSGPRPFSEPEPRTVRRLTRELRPRVSIWYHQPWGHVVLPKRRGVTRRVARRYARIARFPAHRLHGRRAHLRGTAVSWQKHVLRGRAAFVVELPAGSLSRREVRRHARAVLRVARGGTR